MRRIKAIVAGALLALAGAQDPRGDNIPSLEQATMLTPFGGRAAFSPDGKRVAFVGRTSGDAYELEIATGRLRYLTGSFPHQGIMRIQYLPNGDFLVTAPRVQFGPNTRAHLEMWVLRKDLSRGLEPLSETVFEGIAVSRRRNLIAWTTIEPALQTKDSWQMSFVRPTKRYVAEIAYVGGGIVQRRRGVFVGAEVAQEDRWPGGPIAHGRSSR